MERTRDAVGVSRGPGTAVVAIHPLSGKRITDEFSVKPGRAYVMLSNHRSHLSLLIDDQAAAVLRNGDQEDGNVRLASTVLHDMLDTTEF